MCAWRVGVIGSCRGAPACRLLVLAAAGLPPGLPPPNRSPLPSHPPLTPPARQDETPWWKQITVTQLVIVASFTTIIGLMIGTFFFVLSTGAIRMNE